MKKNKSTPEFSIITVCFNDALRLKETIVSVLEQNLKSYEFLIIDGGSTDETS